MKIYIVCSILGSALGFSISAPKPNQGFERLNGLPVGGSFANVIQKRSDRQKTSYDEKTGRLNYVTECMTVVSLQAGQQETWIHRSNGEPDTCGVYIVSDPETRVEIEVQDMNLDCKDSLIMLFDGWELNGNVIPSDADHQLPMRLRESTLCGQTPPYNKRILVTSQNAGLVSFRVPVAGQGFKVNIRAVSNPDVCNILMSEIEGFFTLSNEGRARNCSLTTLLFPASFALLSLDVGHPGGRNKRSQISPVETQCFEHGHNDYIELGGAMDLDSNLLTSETICGHKNVPVKSGLTVLCGSSTVRLVSSGKFHNSVTVFVKAAEEEDLVDGKNTIITCPQ